MRAIAKEPCPSDDFRKGFLNIWLRDGDKIRQEVDNDLVLCERAALIVAALRRSDIDPLSR